MGEILVPCIPYKGSKRKIATRIVEFLPSAETFVDLFAGGGAVTSAAMLSRKYHNIIMNDREPYLTQNFADIANGNVNFAEKYYRWISRDEFNALKDTDPIIRFCYSFGNNGRNYLYNRDIEPWKRAYHLASLNGDFTEIERFLPFPDQIKAMDNGQNKRLNMRAYIGCYIVNKYKHVSRRGNYYISKADSYDFLHIDKAAEGEQKVDTLQCLQCLQSLESLERLESLQRLESLERLESLQRLERLERLQRLQSLQSLERLTPLQLDYTAVPIPSNALVYADPPYRGTDGYGIKEQQFDSDAFFDWVRSLPNLCIISEYNAPEDFVCVKAFSHRCTFDTNSNYKVVERLFCHKSKLHMLPQTELFTLW